MRATGSGGRRWVVLVAGLVAAALKSGERSTLVEALTAHAHMHGERPHLWLWGSGADDQCITYGELDRAARAIAGGLTRLGLQPGDRVAVMLPTEAGFFFAFLGILFAGGIPVPIYPPVRRSQVEDHLRRQAGILRNAGLLHF